MNRTIKHSLFLAAVALLAFLPFALQAQGELTLESLAKQLTALTGRVDAIEQHLALSVDTPSTPTQNPPTPTQNPPGPVANQNANLRSGPGTNYTLVGRAQRSQALRVVARNAVGDWYQLENGAWIAAFLVDNAPDSDSLPIRKPPPPQPTPTTATSLPTPTQQGRGNCHPSYPTVCIPPSPPDLDCGEIPYRQFQVIGADPHRFDGDKDGIGCEW